MTNPDSSTAAREADFGNPDFLKIAMFIVVIGSLLSALLIGVLAPQQYRRLTGFALATVAAALTLAELRRGRTARAYRMLTYGAWCGMTVSAAINGGMTSPAILAYPVLVVIAGWVMGTRTVLILTGLSLAAELFFVAGMARHWLPEQASAPDQWIFLAHALMLTVSASLAVFVRRSFVARFSEIAHRDEKLSAQHALYRTLLEAQSSAGMGMLILERGRIVYANDAVCHLYGYTRAELLALPSYGALIHPNDRSRVADNYRRRLAGDALQTRYDIVTLTKDGARREVEITVVPLPADQIGDVVVIVADITERRRAEAAARRSEERFAQVFQVTPVAASISRFDDGRYLEVNEAFLHLFEWPRHQVTGRSSIELGIWSDPAARQAWLDALAATGTLLGYETHLRDRGGATHTVSISAEVIEFAEQRCILSFVYDITARRHAESMLREIVEGTSRVTGGAFFHALVRHLARALDVPFAVVGEVRPGDATKLHTLAFWAGDHFAAEMDYELAGAPCGTVFGREPRLFAADLAGQFPQAGCLVQALGAASYYGHPLTDAAGAPLGVLAIMDKRPLQPSEERDALMAIFAARAAAELERQKAEAGVRQSEQKFSQIFRASPVAISIGRLSDGFYLEVNDAYVRQFGWERDELIGRTSADIHLWVDPERRGLWVEDLRRKGRVAGFEVLLRSRGGQEQSLLVSAEMLDFGGEQCALSFLYDITERKHTERWIRELNADLEERVRRRTAELTEANRELESFAYSISHDLRAPLRGIDGFSRLLQEEYGAQLDQQGGEYLLRVRRAAQRLGTLIDDLLELSRVTRHEMKRVKVDLSALVTEIIEDLRKAEPGRAVAVAVERCCATDGDPQLLRVLLENLLGNAWKYSRHSADARIEFGSETQGFETVYFVRDNGAGFDMAYADKLFAPFQRLHNPADFEGSGIGLASAARVVRRHGGKIWAESALGKGAVFRFSLGGRTKKH